MAFLNSINIVGSGLTAQQLRLDIISENITNSQTTRVENGDGPYRRKMVVFQADMVKEIADAMAATQAFNSNVTAFNTLKSVISSGLEIGR